MTVLARLRDLFTNLDSNKDSAKLMAHDLGLPVARINFDGSAASAWDSLLQVAHQQGQIPALIALASRDAFRGAAPQLAELLRQYREAYPAATPEGEAKVLATYRAWVIKHYDKMQVLGMPAAMPLQQIFTDVYLLDRPTALKRFSREELEQEFQQLGRLRSHDEKERVAGLTLAQRPGNLFILGKPGAGKTTFSKYLAVQTAKQTLFPDYIPVFVSLKELSDVAKPLVVFVWGQLVAGGVPRSLAAAWIRQKKLLLLLDGLDEATARRDGIMQQIKDFSRRFDQSKLVLTCRIAAVEYNFSGFTYVEMADFSPEQVERFVSNWFEAVPNTAKEMLVQLAKQEHQGIRELARTPLLLVLLCLAYQETLHFPARRVEIYKEALEALLKKWDALRGIKRLSAYGQLSLGRREQMLAQIAYQTFVNGEYFIEQARLETALKAYVVHVPEMPAAIDIEPDKVLNDIIAQHGLFVERARQIFSFSHLTLHEYFAARYIVENVEEGTLAELVRHSHEDRWREVFLLVASMLPKGETFFDLFLKALAQPMAADKVLVALLHQASQAARYGSLAGRKLAAIRSGYLYLALACTLDLDLTLDAALDLALDLDIDLDLALDLALALDLVRALDFDLARARTLAFDLDIARARALARAFAQGDDSDLFLDVALVSFYNVARVVVGYEAGGRQRAGEVLTILQQARDRTVIIADNLQLFALASMLRQRPWPSVVAPDVDWHAFVKVLADELYKRGFNSKYKLTTEQWQVVANYLQGNQLLLGCLNLAYVRDRAAIENQMLLPPTPNP